VVDVVPTATHIIRVGQVASWSTPTFGGTVAEDHVAPPSVLITIAPCPCPVVVGEYPATRQVPADVQESARGLEKPVGRLPSWLQVFPKSMVRADPVLVPSLVMAVQAVTAEQVTLVSTKAPVGAEVGVQVSPPLRVVRTMPDPGTAPVEPTAMHDDAVGQEIPLSSGGDESDSAWADQLVPPLAVLAITVTGATVVVVVALGPATPTAQQWKASAHETAPSSPVPAGAGWPITVTFGDCWPRTLAEVGGRGCDTVQADTTSPASDNKRGTVRFSAGRPRPTREKEKTDTAVGE
jgi:hypothetical protein